MDRLTGMETFVRVVELGGFTAAAAAVNISPTMVSNHIRALERRLGARLLNRTTRRQSLTEIGTTYYAQCLDILGRIDSAENEARDRRSRPTGRLRISAPITLGAHLLVPAFAEYLREYAEVEIELQLNDRMVDLADEGFDAAFRFGELSDSSLIARRLGNPNRGVCASPIFLTRHGPPQKPDDLVNHNCLAFHYVQPERDWLFRGARAEGVRVAGQLPLNNGPAFLVAVLADVGIAMLPDYLVSEDLTAGRLVRLFREFD